MYRRFIASLVCLAACASDDVPTGQLGAAIVGTGGSGTMYRLPAGAFLSIAVGQYSDGIWLDGDDSSLTFEVPVGDGTAHLLHVEGYQEIWPLERLLPGGGYEVVYGRLLTPMPMSFTVLEDETTSLVISFEVAGGTITFAHGSLEVTVNVDEVGASGATVDVAGTGLVSETDFEQAASLGGLLPTPGTEVGIAMSGMLTGAWYPSIRDAICASAELSVSGGGPEAWSAYLGEHEGGQARVCIRHNEGGPATLTVTAFRVGLPNSEVIADVTDNFRIESTIFFTLDPSPFDGATLDVSALNGSFAGDMLLVTHLEDDDLGLLYKAGIQGQMTFDFVPFN